MKIPSAERRRDFLCQTHGFVIASRPIGGYIDLGFFDECAFLYRLQDVIQWAKTIL
jgi:hypothetical protein